MEPNSLLADMASGKAHDNSSIFGIGTITLAVLSLAMAALAADYAWMLYMHKKMVQGSPHTSYETDIILNIPTIATGSHPSPTYRKHAPFTRQQTLDIFRSAVQKLRFSHHYLLDRPQADSMDK